ncbi:MAG TPA: LLM class flavin-dependent oxidoreductase [Dehalococcoidia bacterium]|nr:LLM class flavin-dependent oxidoreductase [Dehalococcoidia bacterium]
MTGAHRGDKIAAMNFGTFHLYSLPPWSTASEVVNGELEQARWSEDLGFSEAWLAEHNGRVYGIVGSLSITAAALAATTKRIRIGAAVTRLPLHHPLQTAEDLALVDVLSNGRFDWGIGKGYDPLEFESYGVDFDEREERWAEALDIVLRTWRDGRIQHEGKFWQIPETELFPKPVQKPHPPVYLMVTKSDESVLYAAKRLYPVIFGQGPDWDDAKRKVQLYRSTALEAGHSTEAIDAVASRFAQLKQVHLAQDTQTARDEYEKGLMWYFATSANRGMYGFNQEPQPYDYYLHHRSVILGTPEAVGDQIEEFRDYTGINNIVCWFNCGGQPSDQVRRSMALFAEKVMPRFQ